ncbi:MAG: OmpH family outer membrane protein [Alphaproteobacteria bacterium GM7ARS4]|nr:OmpH family outer membrane protein [Alphaproteobacteria bacterium GM7ARS4]
MMTIYRAFFQMMAMVLATGLVSPVWAGGSGGDGMQVPEARIAVIDIQTILRDSEAAISLRKQVDNETRKYRDQWVKRRDKIKDMQQDLERQRNLLSQDAFQKKYREWEKEANDFNDEVKVHEEQLTLASNEALSVIHSDLIKIISALTVESNINIVLGREQVLLLMNNGMDITKEALEALNEQRPSVTLDVAAAAKKIREARERSQ